MLQVQANEAVASILRTIKQQSELINDQGKVIGYYYPAGHVEDAPHHETPNPSKLEDVRNSQSADGPSSTTGEMIDRPRSSEDA